VRALHTPGHRPEHTAFALIDHGRGEEPWAVLTGDSLFVGAIARPDLAVDKAEGARGIFRSLHSRILTLPDTCEVWPGHLGGSLCGGPGMDLKVCSTIGYEREAQALLQVTDEDAFVAETTASLPPQPPNFQAIVGINRGPLLRDSVEVHPLTPRQVGQAQRTGALVVDIRTDLQFDEAHIPDAVSISARRAGFGSKLAWVAEPGQALIFAGRDDDDARQAAELASAVGLRNIAGVLAGGMTSWREEKLPVETVRRMTADEVRASADELQLLDVRELAEFEEGHVEGSLHTPYHDLGRTLPEGLDEHLPIAVMCNSGPRAAVAASLLKRQGFDDVIHVVEGGVKDLLARSAAAS
jgi:rhodanese-related sulfurtransferase